MENTTKNRILDEALILFAEKGYKGANLRDLATRLDLSKSALYKHYNSKEDIWNSLLDKMESYYAERFGSESNLSPQPNSCDELLNISMGMVRFTVNDPQIILTRKLLLTEQFHDERVKTMATKYFLTGTKEIYAKIFEQMMADGFLRTSDPEMLSFSYTAPISSLIHLCDREPERQEEIFEEMEAFIKHFIEIHAVKQAANQ